MKISRILKVTGGRLLSGRRDADIDLSKVSTDSRKIKRGEFFIALSGPNFRGSRFVRAALEKGAIGAITEDDCAFPEFKDRTIVKAADATKALQDIASAHRAGFGMPLAGVTGSNGKTTVKDMIAAAVSAKYNTLKSEGTKNNHIGLPQTLLKLKESHEACVLELGSNHKGEISALAAIARPTLGVVTNIGPSHLERFRDLEGVLSEKACLLDSLSDGSYALINGDDPMLAGLRPGRIKILKYGLGESNDIRATDISAREGVIKFSVEGQGGYSIGLMGTHNVHNALAAIAVALIFGVSTAATREALKSFMPPHMRLDPLEVNGIHIINDSYNSNPASMKAALEAMWQCSAKARWVVSADMLELGREAARFHRMAGRLIADSRAAGLVTFGKLSEHTRSGAIACGMKRGSVWHCATHGEIADIIKSVARPGDAVLIKGSRGMRMEKVIENLRG